MENGAEEKLFYSIADVAQMIGVQPSTLRYWEQQFAELRPRRNAGGTRFYTPGDVELLRVIRFLVRDRGLHIAAARAQLAANRRTLDAQAQLAGRLLAIRARVQSLLDALPGHHNPTSP